MSFKMKAIVLIILGAVISSGVMAGGNNQDVAFHWYTVALPIQSGTLALMFLLFGTLLGIFWGLGNGAVNTEQNIAKLKEWQQQDNKLAIEVQKDKEKQLEAKIATLEAALKQALNK